ncbi:uncharacterized protein LOC129807651 [Phlebotomus papatasi]|uniref:uncharacterized protein LOC129807651 n=1 Tax=Phlebotomus papatasi TaxID=29031 RepID=UPI0024839BCE|nr:uncharacterized protein LOC129807651 [Phlebotomus papatasi]XP_055713039.1 uncharacterized protein LOC129807651 [Phlebotomus papatasi]XP_055713040.1 uncharacterized protein LOC129807651 [Phlebotomus papatasi]XP_055713041.1 uncharacterized protein LOC129807651 [Phlebotomus papatasi]XP_055713042.1 uncharacterized protein LOC129807651 [Phlebotomus papatasi]
MALNIALPLSVSEFMDPLDILSPDPSTIGIDCRDRDQIKLLISPISSESSGVSSMGSDEIKKSPEKDTYQDCKIMYGGRNIIDMGSNLTNGSFKIRYTELPENNIPMFLMNRSQYHRLGAHGHIQEYTLIRCSCCGLMIPDQPELVPTSGPNSISRAIIAAQVKLQGNNNNNNLTVNNDSRIYYNNNHNVSIGASNGHNGIFHNALHYRPTSYIQNNNTSSIKYYGNNCPAII